MLTYSRPRDCSLGCTYFKVCILYVSAKFFFVLSMSLPKWVLEPQLGNDTCRQVLCFVTTTSWTTGFAQAKWTEERGHSHASRKRQGFKYRQPTWWFNSFVWCCTYRGQNSLPCASCLHTMRAHSNSLDACDVLSKQITILPRNEQTADALHNDTERWVCTS